jgi:hypothetical protein
MENTGSIHISSLDRATAAAGTVADSFIPWGSGKGGARADPNRRCRSDGGDAWLRGRSLLLRNRSPMCSSPGARTLPARAPGSPIGRA